jgi:hypothetical protein
MSLGLKKKRVEFNEKKSLQFQAFITNQEIKALAPRKI